jgi:hypothetical protein
MTNRSRAGDRQNPRGASAIERAGVIRDPTRGLHQGQQTSAARTGRTHDCTRPTSDVAFFPLHRRARSLIASLLSTGALLLVCRTGVTVLSAVGRIRRNIWSEAQALQCPQRACVAFTRPKASVAATCTLAPSGNHHIRGTARMDPGEGFVRRPAAAPTSGTVRPNARCCAGSRRAF